MARMSYNNNDGSQNRRWTQVISVLRNLEVYVIWNVKDKGDNFVQRKTDMVCNKKIILCQISLGMKKRIITSDIKKCLYMNGLPLFLKITSIAKNFNVKMRVKNMFGTSNLGGGGIPSEYNIININIKAMNVLSWALKIDHDQLELVDNQRRQAK